MQPCVAVARLSRLDGFPENDVPHQNRKIEPRVLAKREPRPCSWIDGQDFVRAGTRIKLEFDLNEAIEPDRGKQLPSRNSHRIVVDDFDKGAGIAELDRILPRPARRHFRNRGIAMPKRRIRELSLSAPGDQFLHDDVVETDLRSSLAVKLPKLVAGIGPPRL